jgi:hypothetical protein
LCNLPSSSISLKLSDEARRNINKLRTADLLPELRRQMSTATNGAVPVVRKAARSIPSHDTKKRTKLSLRSQLASAVGRRIYLDGRRVTVAIVSAPRGGLSNLARCVEGEIPWQHPFFGHKPEVTQPPKPYFYPALEALGPEFGRKIEQVLDDFDRKM